MDIEELITPIQTFREYYSRASTTSLIVFLEVARNEGLTLKELHTNLHISQSLASKTLALLLKFQNANEKGLDLLEAVEDEKQRSCKRIYLTENGKKLIKKIINN